MTNTNVHEYNVLDNVEHNSSMTDDKQTVF